MNERTDFVVVGGGVVGLSCAWYLREKGLRVTVIDRGRYSEAASTGNAGMIVPSHIVPLSAPGVIAKGLRWLANPESPFHIRPRADKALIRWLWLFRRHCTEAHVQYAVPLLRDLSLASRDLFNDLCALEGFEGVGLEHNGLLMLHTSDKARKDDADLARLADAAGLDVEVLDRKETLEREPAIRSEITGSVYFPEDASLHPERFLRAMEKVLRDRGVIFLDCAVSGFDASGRTCAHVRTQAGAVESDGVVIAAGAWTPHLCREFGFNLPVQPAKGYSISIANPETPMRIPSILSDDKVTITPMPGSIRFGGTLSLAGFDDSVDARRVAPIRRQARLYCPELNTEELPDVWSGYRPASPDGLPFIGQIPMSDNVFVATGHGMMGVTLGPVTGRLVSELVSGANPSLDPGPFAPGRHSKGGR